MPQLVESQLQDRVRFAYLKLHSQFILFYIDGLTCNLPRIRHPFAQVYRVVTWIKVFLVEMHFWNGDFLRRMYAHGKEFAG